MDEFHFTSVLLGNKQSKKGSPSIRPSGGMGAGYFCRIVKRLRSLSWNKDTIQVDPIYMMRREKSVATTRIAASRVCRWAGEFMAKISTA